MKLMIFLAVLVSLSFGNLSVNSPAPWATLRDDSLSVQLIADSSSLDS